MVTKPQRTREKRGFRHHAEPWPPAELQLPDTIERIEAGRPGGQRSLFGPDDSREGRLARMVGEAFPRAGAFSRGFTGNSTRGGTF
jgi:hypothetical protein